MELPIIKKLLLLLLLVLFVFPYTRKIHAPKKIKINVKQDIRDAVKQNAVGGIEEALIKAIIKKESYWDVKAYRDDYDKLKNVEWYTNMLSKEERGQRKFYASYGLMQVLYGTAKIQGCKTPEELYIPMVNLYHGCLFLRALLKKFKDIKDVIAFYNGGWGTIKKHRETGRYKNQKYVDYVYQRYIWYGGLRRSIYFF